MSEFLLILGVGMIAVGVLLALFPDSEGGIANFDFAMGRTPLNPQASPALPPPLKRLLAGGMLALLAFPTAFFLPLFVPMLILVGGVLLLAAPRGTETRGSVDDARLGLTPIATGRRIALGLVALGATLAASGCLTGA